MTPGDRFGYLVVLYPTSPVNRMARYRLLCACGNETTMRASDLKRDRVSCGCIADLGRRAANNERRIKAEHARTMREREIRDRPDPAIADALQTLYGFAR